MKRDFSADNELRLKFTPIINEKTELVKASMIKNITIFYILLLMLSENSNLNQFFSYCHWFPTSNVGNRIRFL